jgi:leucine-rich repeat-containing G protein-coupled receptor 6
MVLSAIVPNRLLDPKRRTASWLMARKPSQDSNLSSSRNDSSGSGTTASTSTWRMSRSSASLDASQRSSRAKPRLTRQLAFQEPDSPGSPGRLAVRLLATIPSAAEMSEQCDEESAALAEEKEDEEEVVAAPREPSPTNNS